MPQCSVVIPAYQCAAYIAGCLHSVQRQTIENIEILVVDDCATDETPAIVQALAREDSRIRYFRQAENQGVAAARNRGVQEARSQWIALLDGDDLWMPEKLAKQMALQQETDASLLYTGAQCIDDAGAPLGRHFSVPPRVTYRDMLRGNDVVCSSVLVRRELLLQHPMERNDLHEDYICWLRILSAGCIAAGVQEPLVQYRLTTGSKSRNKRSAARMTWQSYRHVGVSPVKRPWLFACYLMHGLRRYYGRG